MKQYQKSGRCLKELILLILLSMSTLNLHTQTARAAYGGQFSASTSSPPNIDGEIGEGEWIMAGSTIFRLNLNRETYLVKLSIMNGRENLYFLVEVQGPPKFSGGSTVTLWFNLPGERVRLEDVLSINRSWGLDDRFKARRAATISSDTDYGGTNDGSAKISFSNGTEIFEFSHPNCSEDFAHDFCLQYEDRISFRFGLSVDDDSTTWPEYEGVLRDSYADIVLKMPDLDLYLILFGFFALAILGLAVVLKKISDKLPSDKSGIPAD